MIHCEGVVQSDEVTAKQCWFQFGDVDDLPLPHVPHTRDDVASSDHQQFLTLLLNDMEHEMFHLGHGGLWNITGSDTMVRPSALYRCLR